MKLNKKHSTLLFGILMSLFMSLTISLVFTIINFGIKDNFFSVWLRGCILGFAVGFPTSLVAIPFVRRIVDKITSS